MLNIHHSGMVAIVGRPNAGKSTLVNKIIGEKVAIVAPKPQTTRKRLCAVHNQDGVQMVLMDTPGFHTPKTKLGQYMLREVRDSLSGVDAVVLLVAPVPQVGRLEEELLADCRRQEAPVILCVNKIDTLSREALLPVIAAYEKALDFHAILPLSAKTGDGVDKLDALLRPLMPEGGALFPEDMSTDQPERALISETIREKLLLSLDDEIPHGAAVTVETLKERSDGLVNIEAVVTCEKDSHKGIIIGKQGAMLKKIGSMARRDLEEMYEGKVYLKLWVRVRDRWRDNPSQLANFGYSEP